jgi:hypothetical protein
MKGHQTDKTGLLHFTPVFIEHKRMKRGLRRSELNRRKRMELNHIFIDTFMTARFTCETIFYLMNAFNNSIRFKNFIIDERQSFKQ